MIFKMIQFEKSLRFKKFKIEYEIFTLKHSNTEQSHFYKRGNFDCDFKNIY
jgi:hypothetical protein